MTILLDITLCAVLAVIGYYVFEIARLVYAFRGIPRLHESFPCSLPLDLIFSMRRLRKKVKKQPEKAVTHESKTKMYPRWLFKAMDVMVPQYYDQPVVCCLIGPKGFVLACTPESVEAILSNVSNVNKGFSHHFLKPWLGNGLLSNPGDTTWKVHRKMLTPTMHFRILDDYRQTMNENALRFVDKLRRLNNEQVDIYPLIRMCTFSILFETAFGIRLDENDPEHLNFLGDCDELADRILARIINIPHWFDSVFRHTSAGRQMEAASLRITDYIYKVIDMKLASLENNNEMGKSFIDTVIKMHQDGLLSRHDVRDHVATFIVGGFDTTATAMAYTLHLLAHHPEMQEELLNEVESVVTDDASVSKEQLKMLTLTEAVTKESMRLFPPLPMITRNVSKPVRVGKHVIPSGTVGLVDIFHLHRNPCVWEDPEKFKPSRFLDSKNRHPYSFVPFSAGPRNCIGQKFANQEDKILLAHIVKNFTLHTDQASDDLRLSFDLILRPLNGISIRCQPRTV
ncbi:cytochrome P450 4V2 [Galendromus occidentalis]|uniref:Cytochrome P450 4V2 n=1 Tax=Galendromus occidentalis TaxID=34638 RepID=A0AAJ7L2N8_9ACAR|nr:cytochrome P450 4V2 [Galendromus occidentalis]